MPGYAQKEKKVKIKEIADFPYVVHVDDETDKPTTPYEDGILDKPRTLCDWELARIAHIVGDSDVSTELYEAFLARIPLKSGVSCQDWHNDPNHNKLP